MWLCHESVYQAIYQPGSALLRPSPLAPHRRSPLRSGCDHRRANEHAQQRRPRFEQPMLTISQRPFGPEDRSQAGHWGGRSHHRRGPAVSHRHRRRTADPGHLLAVENELNNRPRHVLQDRPPAELFAALLVS